MMEGADGLHSKALEIAYSTWEETFPFESNKLSGYYSVGLDTLTAKGGKVSLTKDRTIGGTKFWISKSSAVKVAP